MHRGAHHETSPPKTIAPSGGRRCRYLHAVKAIAGRCCNGLFVDAFLSRPFLPAPDSRLALGGALHDRHRAASAVAKHDTGAPDVLLRATAVRHDSFEPVTLSGGYFDDDPGAHRTDSHVESAKGIRLRTRPSRSIH
jgi:hypothetical protein